MVLPTIAGPNAQGAGEVWRLSTQVYARICCGKPLARRPRAFKFRSVRNIREILNATVTFPVELTVTTGEKFDIEHPDFTYLNPNSGHLWHFPKDGPIVVIDPAHIVKVLPKGRATPF